jgi:nuclear RNA export factor
MFTVFDIVVENYPDLAALDLSENKLYSLHNVRELSIKLPNLKVLHIGRNKIQDVNQVDCLEGLLLGDLVLDGNPLCSRYKDHNIYVTDVRKRFPKVLKLDGVDLSPLILFDFINEDLQIPTIKGNNTCSEEGLSFVRRFLGEYYQLCDNDNREQLAICYLENSMFSIKSTYSLV